jgi:hypothetical protein
MLIKAPHSYITALTNVTAYSTKNRITHVSQIRPNPIKVLWWRGRNKATTARRTQAMRF